MTSHPPSGQGFNAPIPITGDGGTCTLFPFRYQWNGGDAFAFGEFQCTDAAGGADLVRQAADVARDFGVTGLIGPMNGSTWHSYRFVTESDGSPPFFLEPQNPTICPTALEAAGMVKINHYASAIDQEVKGRARSMGARGITVRSLQNAPTRADLKVIHQLSLATFTARSFYRPIDFEDFAALYEPLLPLVDPSLVFLAEDESGEAVGFLFALPDLATEQALLKTGSGSASVILKSYGATRPGLGALLGSQFYTAARQRGASAVIHALYEETNLSAAHSKRVGGKVFRRYALWGLAL